MTDPISRRILDHLADSRYQPRQTRELAQELGVDESHYEEFAKTVAQLIEEGHVILGNSEAVVLPPPGGQMIGMFRLNERGFGFIIPDADLRQGHGDLFVPPGSTGGAMTGDHVRAKVIHQPQRSGGAKSPYVGRIIEILKRSDRHYVGNLIQRGKLFLVEVDGKLLHDPVVVRDPGAKDAAPGDKVVIELIRYPEGDALAEGVITEVLGAKGEPDVETIGVMRAFGLVEKFSPDVVAEARQAAASFSDQAVPADREDLTKDFIITVDPPDARDFDDAISIRRVGSGFELGVHIADVSHFVVSGTVLDVEAQRRGNSTYLPRKVVPMLPELLSNGVCSLQEGVNRFVKSCFIDLDAEGRPTATRFANAVIRSAKRLTYLEAQALINDDLREARKHAKTEPKYPPQLINTLKLMDELARIIRKRRMADGMISLALPEVDLVFDESGRVIDAVPEDDAFTHTIIEMFMVEANEAAARVFDSLNIPMIRRIHPDPEAHDITELRQFARVAGFNIPAQPSRRELQELLESVRGKPAQQAVHFAVLKTLSKAEYSPAPIGHFALASEHYTHFTSPIRRYPDLVVHRALGAFIRAKPTAKHRQIAKAVRDDAAVPDEKTLTDLGRHCSATERNSEAAERDLREYLVLELMAQHLGDDFQGTVTGVTSQGLFVQIDRYVIDGFIKAQDLPGPAGELWKLNRTTGALVAQRSGRRITIGDRFIVRIARVDPPARKMDLVIMEDRPGKTGKEPHKQPEGARKAHQETMKIKRGKPGKPGKPGMPGSRQKDRKRKRRR